MASELFDYRLRAMRRDRAFRLGPELFLLRRAFEDCFERLADIRRRFERALLIGCPDPPWPEKLLSRAGNVEAADPGPLFALAANGRCIVEDETPLPPATYDLCIAVGTLDTVNNLQLALANIRQSLKEDSLFIGAFAGGDTLPRLRHAMRAADAAIGSATPHVHPRIEASSVTSLLSAAGFTMPVVDVDRVQVAYPSFDRLVQDLRRMGSTNILASRSRTPLTKAALRAANATFEAAGDGRTVEVFEIIHFAAWTPAPSTQPSAG